MIGRIGRIVGGVALLIAAAAPGWAQGYPARAVRIVVGFPAGSAADLTTRIVGAKLGERLGQGVVIENKPGASSNIATDLVIHAAPDGYTLLMGTIANTINPALTPNLPFDFATDLVPVALVGTLPNLLVVHPKLHVETVAALIALAKARPSAITYGSSGTGTAPHLSGELFNTTANVQLVHVPYKGSSQAMTDLLAGEIGLMFAPASTALPQLAAGKLKGLATTGARRSAAAPDLPTLAEAGLPGYETGVWCGLLAPKATPADIVARLEAAVGEAVASPEVAAQFAAQGIDPLDGGQAVFRRYIASETEKWARVVKTAGIKAD